jgi:hypothetical protein
MAFIKPKEGYVIVDPTNFRILPASGAEVTLDFYYQKLIINGDVSVVELPTETTTETTFVTTDTSNPASINTGTMSSTS